VIRQEYIGKYMQPVSPKSDGYRELIKRDRTRQRYTHWIQTGPVGGSANNIFSLVSYNHFHKNGYLEKLFF
jgi:hypothetical protein